jgi:hypothetical protein
MALHSEAKLDHKFTEFAKLMNVHLNHFPRHEKYALAQEIRRAAYDVYGFVVEAQRRYHKKTTLTNLDIRHEQLRMFLRLAFELGYFQFKDGKTSDASPERLAQKRYIAISQMVDELGRMIGGLMAAERGLNFRACSPHPQF